MAKIREFRFISGPEQAAMPAAGTVSGNDDLVTVSYLKTTQHTFQAGINVSGNFAATGNALITGTQSVTGNANFGGTITSVGAITAGGNISGSGALNATGALSIGGNASIVGDGSVTGNFNAGGFLKFGGIFEGEVVTDSSSSGTDVDLTVPTKFHLRLTNGSLDSIRSIAAPATEKTQIVLITNLTGSSLDIKDEEATATAANRIRTGTGATLSVANNASVIVARDKTSQRWRVIGGSGGGGSSSKAFGSDAPGAAKTANYSVVAGDDGGTILCDTSAGSITVTLADPTLNVRVIIKDSKGYAGINPIYVAPYSTEKIDNETGTDAIVESFGSKGYMSNGTDYFRLLSFRGESIAGRGVIGGGDNVTPKNDINYITITTVGNSTDFGDLTVARSLIAGGVASSTRGCFAGGDASGTLKNEIDYITIATAGNATDFGDLVVTRSSAAGFSNSTRGLFIGGVTSGSTFRNEIDYITIASTGNATDFGDLTTTAEQTSGCASTTRGIRGAGANVSGLNVIDYVTIASTGNATDFGDTTVSRHALGGCSNSIRGLFGSGNAATVNQNVIDYITIATAGNATDFGDLTQARRGAAAFCNSLRAVWAGGYVSNAVNTMDYVTIASTGNATDFGDLINTTTFAGGLSNAHGGL